MAEVLKEYAFVNTHHARRTNYRQFCDGRIYRLIQGVDFNVATKKSSVTNGLYMTAQRLGMVMHIVAEKDKPLTFVVQATKRTDRL